MLVSRHQPKLFTLLLVDIGQPKASTSGVLNQPHRGSSHMHATLSTPDRQTLYYVNPTIAGMLHPTHDSSCHHRHHHVLLHKCMVSDIDNLRNGL
jgi:hypothetical protein